MQKIVKFILLTALVFSCNIFSHAKTRKKKDFIEQKLAEKKLAKKSQLQNKNKKRKTGYPKFPWAFARETYRPSYRNPNGISGPFSHCGENSFRYAGNDCYQSKRGIERFFTE